jgi:hypothetical protein
MGATSGSIPTAQHAPDASSSTSSDFSAMAVTVAVNQVWPPPTFPTEMRLHAAVWRLGRAGLLQWGLWAARAQSDPMRRGGAAGAADGAVYDDRHRLDSPLDEFGCMQSAACAETCGVRCISECCRDQSCLQSDNPADWAFPVEYGVHCYQRCYEDCAYDWEVRSRHAALI